VARTCIGNGSPNMAGKAEVHGAPLGAAEVAATKKNLGWPEEPTFLVPDEVRAVWAARVKELQGVYSDWQKTLKAWTKANPELAAQRDSALNKTLPVDLEEQLVAAAAKPNATRRLSGDVLAKLGQLVPNLVGGSADLAPSTSTYMKGLGDIGRGAFGGRNFHFGVREHGMGGILNGIALYGGFIPFGATFLVFADYMRPSIRVANIMGVQVVYVFTHDSIFVGEDGPTHEPIEQIASLRMIPRMTVLRPADGPEVGAAWAYALRHQDGPTALILSRQKVPAIQRELAFSAAAFNRGGYTVAETAGRAPDVVLVGTGSELQLAMAAKPALEQAGYAVRVVSMPSVELFKRQDEAYRVALLPASARKVVVEAGTRFGWGDVVGCDALFLTQDGYGASAPFEVLAEEFGFTPEKVTKRILEWL
jgi:transketolase